MKCENCGFTPNPGDQVCINCGAKLKVATIQSINDIEKLSYVPEKEVKSNKKVWLIALITTLVIILIAIIIGIILIKR